MKKLLVIDANSILNSAFYAVAPLTSPSGVPTNAVFGLLSSVLSQWEALAPDTAVAAFDVKAPTFRHQMYDAYKAGRRPPSAPGLKRMIFSEPLPERRGSAGII